MVITVLSIDGFTQPNRIFLAPGVVCASTARGHLGAFDTYLLRRTWDAGCVLGRPTGPRRREHTYYATAVGETRRAACCCSYIIVIEECLGVNIVLDIVFRTFW